MTEKNICIIPARGGSKRLPRKNIIDFNGKPIIAYSIEAALETNLFEKVIVSTEDEEITNIAAMFGAEIDNRKKELASDRAKVVEVCLDFLNREKKTGNLYNILCCLYPTAPLRNSDDIKRTIELVMNGKCNYAIAVTEFHYPVHQALKFDNASNMEPMWPELIFKNSNELPPLCVDNGSTYAMNIGEFMKSGSFYSQPLKGYFMPRERSVDIDTKSDLELANYYASIVPN